MCRAGGGETSATAGALLDLRAGLIGLGDGGCHGRDLRPEQAADGDNCSASVKHESGYSLLKRLANWKQGPSCCQWEEPVGQLMPLGGGDGPGVHDMSMSVRDTSSRYPQLLC